MLCEEAPLFPFAAMMARLAEPALSDLLELYRRRGEAKSGTNPLLEATVSIGGDNEVSYTRVSLKRWSPGATVKIHVYSWDVNHDLARYVGGDPPPDEEDALLRSRGPVSPHRSIGSWRVAEELCRMVGGTDLTRGDDGLAYFSLTLS